MKEREREREREGGGDQRGREKEQVSFVIYSFTSCCSLSSCFCFLLSFLQSVLNGPPHSPPVKFNFGELV